MRPSASATRTATAAVNVTFLLSVLVDMAADTQAPGGLDEILDRQLVSAALAHLSPAHRSVLVETFYQGGTMATVARELGIARSRLHYALDALRQHLQEHDAIAC